MPHGDHKKIPCSGRCGVEIRRNKTGLCAACLARERAGRTIPSQVRVDRERREAASEIALLRKKYEDALKTIAQRDRDLDRMQAFGDTTVDTFRIEPRLSSGKAEGTVVVLASDWHVEENVGAEVGGLNLFDVDIAKTRAERFFRGCVRLTRLLQQDIAIDTMVLALLGDFFSNDIHEEFTDTAELQPMHAVLMAESFIASGIEHLLEHSKLNLVLPCHSGNHARTTKTTRFASENGHSLEYLMYRHLAAYFRGQPRVQFVIPEGMHSYLDVYGTTIRFQHGHAIKYQGGVGGIYIPVNKAIAQWNKARHADLDCFAHFHQLRDGGNFVCNGSLIGYNAFALSIKADYEPPKQALFLIDKKRGRTCTWPVILDQRA